MARRKPSLERQRRSLQRTLDEVRAEAAAMLSGWANLEQESGRDFLTERLTELAQRRSDLASGLLEMNQALAQIERLELLRLLLRRAELGDRQVVLEIYPVAAPDMAMPQSRSRSEAPSWLPGKDSNLQPSG
jgi:hypothetical protein